ncbi:unnamed protein product [Rhizoctonia solani]|uniref:LYC1 C-terminal domain-containing protein n=1 Tax=Rhizoctonia solani TaxID=456999 RepID=A0A8H3CXW4_9AGAM|nr:unnamed protein product [Rhizoctonia solani]
MSLEHLIVRPATEAQAREVILRNAAHWGVGAGVPIESYLKLCAIFLQGPAAREGRLKIWILVPEDDPETPNFYASCLTFARGVLTLQPGQASPSSSFGHAITSVLVPPQHRGKGYAKRFMSLMHSALAPHRYPNLLKAPTATDHPSTVSVLYSDVNNFYARCTPSEGESGWSLQKSFTTTWSVAGASIPPTSGDLLPAVYLSESDATATLDSDDSNIPGDLLELQKNDPTKTYFAFAPTSPLNDYSATISKFFLGELAVPSWGVKISGRNDFMTWVPFSVPRLQLVVTRLRATVDSFPVLLSAALRVAQEANYGGVEIFNVPEHLREVARVTGGETTERETCLSAFKWYGQQPNSKTVSADVFWALDER